MAYDPVFMSQILDYPRCLVRVCEFYKIYFQKYYLCQLCTYILNTYMTRIAVAPNLSIWALLSAVLTDVIFEPRWSSMEHSYVRFFVYRS